MVLGFGLAKGPMRRRPELKFISCRAVRNSFLRRDQELGVSRLLIDKPFARELPAGNVGEALAGRDRHFSSEGCAAL
jgi:hypothetical protein